MPEDGALSEEEVSTLLASDDDEEAKDTEDDLPALEEDTNRLVDDATPDDTT